MNDPFDSLARRLWVVYFRPSGASDSPVEKEYHEEVRQPKGRAKIDAVLRNVSLFGLRAAGIRFEKVKGTPEAIYELKIKAFGSEHRFLAAYAPGRTAEGHQILVLLKYIKKKEWRLSRTDIDTAAKRLARVQAG